MRIAPLHHNILAFVCGLGAVTQVNIGITHLSFSEILLSAIAPYLLFTGHSLRNSQLKIVFILLSLWVFAACISDFYINYTHTTLALKGIVRLIILGLCIYSLYFIFQRNPLVWRYYVIGAFFSVILGFTVFRMSSLVVDEVAGEVRGYGWGETYNYIFVAFLAIVNAWFYERYPRLVCCMLTCGGVLNLALGSRSAGAIAILVSLVLWYFTGFIGQGKTKTFRLKFSAMIFAGFVGFVSCVGLYFAYSVTASSGMLGEKARVKYDRQSQSPMGLLLGGRPEVVGGVIAVWDKPFLGHGSFALDYEGYWVHALEVLGEYNLKNLYVAKGGFGYIPTHSKILEAWVSHGFLGALFWLYLLFFYIKFIQTGLLAYPALLGALVVIVFNAFWHYSFSPIGFRVVEASSIALVFAMADRQRLALQSRYQRMGA